MRRRSKQFARRHRIVSAVLLGVCIFLLQTVLTVAVLSHEPGFAAHSADVLRGIIGDENVARLETFVLGWQDTYQSWVYHAGGDPPQAPFASPTPGPVTVALIITPTPTPIPADTNGSPVLTATSLHYELGTLEPAAYDPLAPIERPGHIPSYDLNSGLVVAAFNGGFRAKHGQFGVMVNGTVIIGPRLSFGTVAMYDDGRMAIGTWGDEIYYANGLRNWRQNGPLIVHNGRVNPHSADAAPLDWGYTADGATATWRSGLDLSADGHTLYYLAGPYLTLPVLAEAMANTDAANAIQLDINSYWVHFDAIQSSAEHSCRTLSWTA